MFSHIDSHNVSSIVEFGKKLTMFVVFNTTRFPRYIYLYNYLQIFRGIINWLNGLFAFEELYNLTSGEIFLFYVL